MESYFAFGKFTVYCGDVAQVLPTMEGETFDACLCDPPYGLSFMGREWDHGVPARPTWEAVLRVLKPGAPLLAFGGTRTHHRLMCAIEDAGFEIRDCLMWLYGCLSADTEILIDGRWEPYHKAIAGSLALCYNVGSGEFSYQPIQELVTYDYDDTAYRIRSDSTDQIVSRNHHCIVEHGGVEVFEFAEDAAQESEIRVPVLEDLQGLLEALPMSDQGTGHEKSNMLPKMSIGETPRATPTQAAGPTEDETNLVYSLWDKGVETPSVAKGDYQPDLFLQVQRNAARGGVRQARIQGAGSVDEGIGTVLLAEDERREQSGMEGRGNILTQARELQADQVRPMPGGVPGDGPQGRLCGGTPPNGSETDGKTSSTNGSGSPRQPRSYRQRTGVDAVSEQPGAQAVRASRFTHTDLARISPFHYRGVVWCVRVPTGAFVARRNSKVFVTGNSGFPKSLDIGKAIDKAAGAERGRIEFAQSNTWREKEGRVDRQSTVPDREPITNAAKLWNGWGTALKPAWEIISLCMKPLDGTFAENALKWGVAGLNVDGCRIATNGEQSPTAVRRSYGYTPNTELASESEARGALRDRSDPEKKAAVHPSDTLGRWPANLLLDEEAAGMLDEQSGIQKSGVAIQRNAGGQALFGGIAGNKNTIGARPDVGFGDSGGASRYFKVIEGDRFVYCAKASRSERGGSQHPTMKPTKLCEYLAKLLLPPPHTDGSPRRILVPFSGSGSEMLGALRAGWDEVVGIELDEHWCDISTVRLMGA